MIYGEYEDLQAWCLVSEYCNLKREINHGHIMLHLKAMSDKLHTIFWH